MSGALILQGNPTELLNTSFFAESDAVDISGTALEDVDGSGVENVSVELLGCDVQSPPAKYHHRCFRLFFNERCETRTAHHRLLKRVVIQPLNGPFVPDNVGLDLGDHEAWERDEGRKR